MRLFFNRTSPYARKARIAVLEAGLEQQVAFVDINPWDEPGELIAVNPLSKVPALLIANGPVVTESDAIIQVLHTFGPDSRLLADDDKTRNDSLTRAALCQGLIDASFVSVIESRRPPHHRWDEWIMRQERAIIRTLSVIEATFHLSPDRFDIGDIGLACALAYLDFRLAHLPWRIENPRLSAWFDQAALRRSMAATTPC